jgi:hypothetical protein
MFYVWSSLANTAYYEISNNVRHLKLCNILLDGIQSISLSLKYLQFILKPTPSFQNCAPIPVTVLKSFIMQNTQHGRNRPRHLALQSVLTQKEDPLGCNHHWLPAWAIDWNDASNISLLNIMAYISFKNRWHMIWRLYRISNWEPLICKILWSPLLHFLTYELS